MLIKNIAHLVFFILSLFFVFPSCASDWVEDGGRQSAPKTPLPDMPVSSITKDSDSYRDQSPDSLSNLQGRNGGRLSTTKPLITPNLLKGGVQHSDRVKPLDSRYLPGQHFDLNAKDDGEVVDDWVQIPNWISGVSSKEQSLITHLVDYRTGYQSSQKTLEMNRAQSSRGHQIDQFGKTWHLNRVPYRAVLETENGFQITIVKTSKFLKSDDESVVCFSSGPAIFVGKRSGLIEKAAFLECITVYHFNGRDILSDPSVKSFDSMGRPTEWNTRKERFTLITPFQIDHSTDESFSRFMKHRAGRVRDDEE